MILVTTHILVTTQTLVTTQILVTTHILVTTQITETAGASATETTYQTARLTSRGVSQRTCAWEVGRISVVKWV